MSHTAERTPEQLVSNDPLVAGSQRTTLRKIAHIIERSSDYAADGVGVVGSVGRGTLKVVGAIAGEIAGATGEIIAAGKESYGKFQRPLDNQKRKAA